VHFPPAKSHTVRACRAPWLLAMHERVGLGMSRGTLVAMSRDSLPALQTLPIVRTTSYPSAANASDRVWVQSSPPPKARCLHAPELPLGKDYLGAIERALVAKIGVESISRSRGNMVAVQPAEPAVGALGAGKGRVKFDDRNKREIMEAGRKDEILRAGRGPLQRLRNAVSQSSSSASGRAGGSKSSSPSLPPVVGCTYFSTRCWHVRPACRAAPWLLPARSESASLWR